MVLNEGLFDEIKDVIMGSENLFNQVPETTYDIVQMPEIEFVDDCEDNEETENNLTASACLTELLKQTLDNMQQINATISVLEDSEKDELVPLMTELLSVEQENVSKIQCALGSCNDRVISYNEPEVATGKVIISEDVNNVELDNARQVNEGFDMFLKSEISTVKSDANFSNNFNESYYQEQNDGEMSLADAMLALWE